MFKCIKKIFDQPTLRHFFYQITYHSIYSYCLKFPCYNQSYLSYIADELWVLCEESFFVKVIYLKKREKGLKYNILSIWKKKLENCSEKKIKRFANRKVFTRKDWHGSERQVRNGSKGFIAEIDSQTALQIFLSRVCRL